MIDRSSLFVSFSSLMGSMVDNPVKYYVKYFHYNEEVVDPILTLLCDAIDEL